MLAISRRSAMSGIGVTFVGLAPHRAHSAAWTMQQSLPDNLVVPAAKWLMEHFGTGILNAAKGTNFPPSIFCAIACQESGYAWFAKRLRDNYSPAVILRLMVLDANAPRAVFPRDTGAFLADSRFKDLANDLVAASDASRMARGIAPTHKLYYGYGIFQYDLQHITEDASFWRDMRTNPKSPRDPPQRGLWGDFDVCTSKLLSELNTKWQKHPNDILNTIRAYNGSGSNAEAYAKIVLKFQKMIRAAGIA